MSTIKYTRPQEAKWLMRLVARSKNWPAEPALRQLTPMQIEALQEYIAARNKQQQKLGVFALLVAVLPLALLTFDTAYMIWQIVFVAALFQYATLNYAVVQNRHAVYALTQTDDLRALPTLILATKYKYNAHPQIRSAILRLLPHVTQEQAGLLNNAAQEQLWMIATKHYGSLLHTEYEITPHAVRALAAVGNYAMLTRMKQFVSRSRRFNYEQKLRIMIQDVLPIMEARLERQQVPETLLRAADVPASAPDTLLRPTFAAPPEPAEQLLRASRSEGE